MTGADAVAWLESLQGGAIQPGLDRTLRMLAALGHPEQRFPAVQVAGTNGKGTTAAFLESVLRRAGYRTGLYTSPHLIDFSERIRVNGVPIAPAEIAATVEDLHDLFERECSTYFEASTVLAIVYFAQAGVDVAVLETGLGGRWDATSVGATRVSVITDIGVEHTTYLGRTVARIATEKAAIIRANIPVISGARSHAAASVIRAAAHTVGAPVTEVARASISACLRSDADGTTFSFRDGGAAYEGLHIPLVGRHQVWNARGALLALHRLRELGWDVDAVHIREGFTETCWPGRMEMLQRAPLVVMDVAHNPMSMRTIRHVLERELGYAAGVVVLGLGRHKDLWGVLRALAGWVRRMVAVPLPWPASYAPETVAAVGARLAMHTSVARSVPDGIWQAVAEAQRGEPVLVTGSHGTVGEAKKAIAHLTITQK